MKDSVTEGREIATEISNMLGLDKDFIEAALPIISNAIYNRDREILMHERLKVIRDLARELDNENFEKVVNKLGVFTIVNIVKC